MVSIAAPGKHHLFLLGKRTLKGRIGAANVTCSRTEGWSLISRHVILLTTSRVKLSNCHGSRATSRGTYGNIVIVSALDICYFSIKQGEDHLWRGNSCLGILYVLLRIIIAISWNIERKFWHTLLFTSELTKVVSAHGVNESTGRQKESMLKPTCNFRDIGRLNLLQRSCHQRPTENRVDTLGKIKIVIVVLYLVVELLSEVHADLVLVVLGDEEIITVVFDELREHLLILLLLFHVVGNTNIIVITWRSLMNHGHHFLNIWEDLIG